MISLPTIFITYKLYARYLFNIMKNKFKLHKHYTLASHACLAFIQFFQRNVYNTFIHIEANYIRGKFEFIIKPSVGLKSNIESNTVKSISKLLYKVFNKREYKYKVKEIKNEFHINKIKDFIKVYNYVCGTQFTENNTLPMILFSTDYITDYKYETKQFRDLSDMMLKYITDLIVPYNKFILSIKTYKEPYKEYNLYIITKTDNIKHIAKRIKNIINNCKYKSYKITDNKNNLSAIQYTIPHKTMDNIKALIKIS